MERQRIDENWKVSPLTGWWIQQKEKPVVNLPYDVSIHGERRPDAPCESHGGFFPGGTYHYDKVLFIPKEWKGRKIYLEFEGVYMNTAVRVNDNAVGRHPYGYTGFLCDITDYLFYGEDNAVRVVVSNSHQPNARWYTGTGIYRHVWLVSGGPIRIAPHGLFVTTPQVSPEQAVVSLTADVVNDTAEPQHALLRATVFDGETVVALDEKAQSLAPGEKAVFQHSIPVASPRLWSPDSPHLYRLKAELVQNGETLDSQETFFGIRSIAFSVEQGFLLNGVPTKLRGGCIHSESGILGACAFDRGEDRKVELMKQAGFNAVRCAHNPPAPAFLDACDRLGMLVIDETFDTWQWSKTPGDYGMFFDDWWQRDVESMILYARNHPSVILYSTGNEVPERNGVCDGYRVSRMLADAVRKLDPTRGVMNALNNIKTDPGINNLSANLLDVEGEEDYFGDYSEEFIAPLDVAGYNYLTARYEKDHQRFPERIICGTESFPAQVFDDWEAVNRLPHVIGDFVWTAMDYFGESGLGHVWYEKGKGFLGDYPWHQAFCGDMDVCGFKRPQSYYRDCVWGRAKAPYIAVFHPARNRRDAELSAWAWEDVVSSWDWPGFEGKPVELVVYSTADEVELLLNGESLGRKPAGKAQRYRAEFSLLYQPGELVAVGYCNGVEESRATLRTPGKPAALRLTADRTCLKAQAGDLSFITVELVDAQGNPVHHAEDTVLFSVCGAAGLQAVGTGNPVSEESYTGNRRNLYQGRAMAVLVSKGETGTAVLTAMAEGVPASSITVELS